MSFKFAEAYAEFNGNIDPLVQKAKEAEGVVSRFAQHEAMMMEKAAQQTATQAEYAARGLDPFGHKIEEVEEATKGLTDSQALLAGFMGGAMVAASRAAAHGVKDFTAGFFEARTAGEGFFQSLVDGAETMVGIEPEFVKHKKLVQDLFKIYSEGQESIRKTSRALDSLGERNLGVHFMGDRAKNLSRADEDAYAKQREPVLKSLEDLGKQRALAGTDEDRKAIDGKIDAERKSLIELDDRFRKLNEDTGIHKKYLAEAAALAIQLREAEEEIRRNPTGTAGDDKAEAVRKRFEEIKSLLAESGVEGTKELVEKMSKELDPLFEKIRKENERIANEQKKLLEEGDDAINKHEQRKMEEAERERERLEKQQEREAEANKKAELRKLDEADRQQERLADKFRRLGQTPMDVANEKLKELEGVSGRLTKEEQAKAKAGILGDFLKSLPNEHAERGSNNQHSTFLGFVEFSRNIQSSLKIRDKDTHAKRAADTLDKIHEGGIKIANLPKPQQVGFGE